VNIGALARLSISFRPVALRRRRPSL